MKKLVSLTALALTLVACSPVQVNVDGSWVLVGGSSEGQEVPILDDWPITLEIDGDHISGTAACNSYGGDVTIDNGTFETTGLFQTEMACMPEEVMDSERIYLTAMAVVDTAAREDERLVLSGPDTELVFEPGGSEVPSAQAVEPSASLFGPETYGDWQLTGGWIDGEPIPMLDTHPITLSVDEEGIGGVAACNHYGSIPGEDGYSITEMACMPEKVMESETAYITALGLVEKSVVEDGLLVVGHGEREVELMYERLDPAPTAELLGTVWVLDGLIHGDTVSSVMGEKATLELFSDGSVIGSTGCRDFSGSYVISGGAVQFTDFRAEGECSADLVDQDSHVISALEGGFRVEIDGDRMTTWVAGDEGLIFRAEN
jgi:heat shock protein HslJ